MASDAANDQAPLPSAYAALSEQLSQGDIVQGMPWAVLEHPLTVCRPDGGKPGRAYYAQPHECTRQPAFARGPEIIHAVALEPGLGIVIWEDCEIDKMRNQQKEQHRWFVAVAPVVPLAVVSDEESRTAIRQGDRHAFFPLPALPALEIPESYVDLRLMWPVRQAMVSERLVTLSRENRAALYGQLLRFLTGRNFAPEISCPACGVVIAADSFLVADERERSE